jgi:hypothetical protein
MPGARPIRSRIGYNGASRAGSTPGIWYVGELARYPPRIPNDGRGRKTNTKADQVGAERAKAIFEKAAPGVMLQAADGSWYEKK